MTEVLDRCAAAVFAHSILCYPVTRVSLRGIFYLSKNYFGVAAATAGVCLRSSMVTWLLQARCLLHDRFGLTGSPQSRLTGCAL